MNFEEDTTPQEYTPEFLEIVKNDTIKHYKQMRNQLLIESDKYMLPDYPITSNNLILIKDYRDKLRNFTNNDYIIPQFPF